MQVLSCPVADGRQIRNSVPLFHTQLNPQWPDLDNLRARESVSKLNQETVINTRHKTKSLPSTGPDTEVFVKDLQRSGKVIEAVSTSRSYKVETPIDQHDKKPCSPYSTAKSAGAT